MSTIGVDKLAEATGEILKVAPQVYDDGLKPAVSQGGKALETITGTLNSLLAPLKCLNAKITHLEEQFITDLDRKAQNIPEENRTEPELSVIGPALEDLKFSLSEDDIRNLYLNLLTSSMDSRSSNLVHRSFVEIIKQLDSSEARLLNFISSQRVPLPIGCIRANLTDNNGGITILEHFTPLYFEGIPATKMSIMFSNLHMLGIIDITYSSSLVNELKYADFELCSVFKEYHEHYINHPDVADVIYRKGILSWTPLGKSFVNICIND